jgi:hypothetical protein
LHFLASPTFSHGFGLVLGVLLILRAQYSGTVTRRRFQVKKVRTSAEQMVRILYLLVGIFFIAAEITYFWFGVDWFNPSTYR